MTDEQHNRMFNTYKYYKMAYAIWEFEPRFTKKIDYEMYEVPATGTKGNWYMQPHVRGANLVIPPQRITWGGYNTSHMPDTEYVDVDLWDTFANQCYYGNQDIKDELWRMMQKPVTWKYHQYKRWLTKPNVSKLPHYISTTETQNVQPGPAPWFHCQKTGGITPTAFEDKTTNPNANIEHDFGGALFENPYIMRQDGARGNLFVTSNVGITCGYNDDTNNLWGHYRLHIFVKWKGLKPARALRATGEDTYEWKAPHMRGTDQQATVIKNEIALQEQGPA